MPMTVICPACGKLNRIQDNAPVGETILCLGCGGRVRIEADALPPAAEHPPQPEAVAESSPVGPDDDATEVPFSAPVKSHGS